MKNFKNILLTTTLAIMGLVFAMACSDDSSSDVNNENQGTIDISVLATKFYSQDVEVVVGENTVTITTKDLPDHKSVYYPTTNPLYENYTNQNDAEFQKNPGEIAEQNIVMTIPRFPAMASTHEAVGLGPMGVSVNSVVFFNQQAAPGDDIFNEIKTFDQYEGHPAGDQYHYHIEPVWLTESLGSSAFLGFLADGFPVYGPMENGAEITNNDLDDYHGHVGVTADFPEAIYHYHVTTEFPWINGDGYYGTKGTITR